MFDKCTSTVGSPTASIASLGLCVVLAMDAAGLQTEGSVALWVADVLYAAVPLAFLVGLLRMRWRRAVVVPIVAVDDFLAVEDAVQRPGLAVVMHGRGAAPRLTQ